MSSDDTIDIHDEVKAICDKLGVEYGCARRLDIYPAAVFAEVFRTDEHGSKYIEKATDEPAMDVREFKVST
jgi:hypothetical protein